MKEQATLLIEEIETFTREFGNVDEKLTSINPGPDKWSLKQIIGHLIDSVSNNHQRIVRMKLEGDTDFPDYQTNQWLKTQPHNQVPYGVLFNLFVYFNKYLAELIATIELSMENNRWKVMWGDDPGGIVLKDLVVHYIDHIKGHRAHFRERLREIEKE